MGLDRRIAALEAQKTPLSAPKEIWWISPTTEADLRRGWQLAIRNYLDRERGVWASEEVRIDPRVYLETNQIETIGCFDSSR
jgi:hypothetical protein